ncbi:MAG TPA: DUF5989 family protein [Gemmatales bacterium]|nr:DUF5989 family protein [Gemmatales bacterium]HMP60263.1 DUF5989 family protein [Gemmatales bacterium]
MSATTKPTQPSGMPIRPSDPSRFEAALSETEPGLASEFWQFLAHNKKWWLLPIMLLLGLLGGLIFLSSTPLAPFIYTLF